MFIIIIIIISDDLKWNCWGQGYVAVVAVVLI